LSTASPAGTINQSARGACSFPINASSEAADSTPFALDALAHFRIRVEAHNAMATTHQALRHVGAHAPQADHSNFHSLAPGCVDRVPANVEPTTATGVGRRLRPATGDRRQACCRRDTLGRHRWDYDKSNEWFMLQVARHLTDAVDV
jgi:hypothetical protein